MLISYLTINKHQNVQLSKYRLSHCSLTLLTFLVGVMINNYHTECGCMIMCQKGAVQLRHLRGSCIHNTECCFIHGTLLL
jgi:hypothetical protein